MWAAKVSQIILVGVSVAWQFLQGGVACPTTTLLISHLGWGPDMAKLSLIHGIDMEVSHATSLSVLSIFCTKSPATVNYGTEWNSPLEKNKSQIDVSVELPKACSHSYQTGLYLELPRNTRCWYLQADTWDTFGTHSAEKKREKAMVKVKFL